MDKPKFTRFKSNIIEIKNLTDNVKHFIISVPVDFTFIPGQYVSIIKDDKLKGIKLRRPYSILTNPNESIKNNEIELCIKIIPNGNITPILDKQNIGDNLELIGPLGEFKIEQESLSKNIILISTGVGIAPFISMIHFILENNYKHNLTLITGYRDESEVLYEDKINKYIKKYNNFRYYKILSKQSNNELKSGRVQILIEENFDLNADYYICGLNDMISSVRHLLLKKGILGKNIYSEKYD